MQAHQGFVRTKNLILLSHYTFQNENACYMHVENVLNVENSIFGLISTSPIYFSCWKGNLAREKTLLQQMQYLLEAIFSYISSSRSLPENECCRKGYFSGFTGSFNILRDYCQMQPLILSDKEFLLAFHWLTSHGGLPLSKLVEMKFSENVSHVNNFTRNRSNENLSPWVNDGEIFVSGL